ncbi:hypothetical protein [Halioxenophilus sp. WMMB6]|uniref:hypothetical protein n=1 Tax=Halioxenophilus sp. WMMB6 TaxID=3073815 RepID=UPI00295E52D9|nr:hypothetical protein [Halioxenophilus sp. WMMB6]
MNIKQIIGMVALLATATLGSSAVFADCPRSAGMTEITVVPGNSGRIMRICVSDAAIDLIGGEGDTVIRAACPIDIIDLMEGYDWEGNETADENRDWRDTPEEDSLVFDWEARAEGARDGLLLSRWLWGTNTGSIRARVDALDVEIALASPDEAKACAVEIVYIVLTGLGQIYTYVPDFEP